MTVYPQNKKQIQTYFPYFTSYMVFSVTFNSSTKFVSWLIRSTKFYVEKMQLDRTIFRDYLVVIIAFLDEFSERKTLRRTPENKILLLVSSLF